MSGKRTSHLSQSENHNTGPVSGQVFCLYQKIVVAELSYQAGCSSKRQRLLHAGYWCLISERQAYKTGTPKNRAIGTSDGSGKPTEEHYIVATGPKTLLQVQVSTSRRLLPSSQLERIMVKLRQFTYMVVVTHTHTHTKEKKKKKDLFPARRMQQTVSSKDEKQAGGSYQPLVQSCREPHPRLEENPCVLPRYQH